MNLQRCIQNKLRVWAKKNDRLPLLLLGARQTGKTWLLKDLGKNCFEHTAYFDFSENPALEEIFQRSRNPESILRDLRLVSKEPIIASKTLIIFDEIQLSDTALGALKHFSEQAPEFAVAASGSLLGVHVKRRGLFAPVGKVDLFRLYPLSFAEYLQNFDPDMFQKLEALDCQETLPAMFFDELKKHFRIYQCVGGMPRALSVWGTGSTMAEVDVILDGVLKMYQLDFAQYAQPNESVRISQVWDSIPSQLARANSRFFLSQVSKKARSREYTPAVQWLTEAGLVSQVHRISSPLLPLSASSEPEIFKLYCCDSGLLRVLSKMPSEALLEDNPNYREFKGCMAENFVANSLERQLGFSPNYWSSGASAEVDFVFQSKMDVIPLEVKAGESLSGKSLGVYRAKYSPSIALRLSMRNFDYRDGLLNIPLPLADWTLTFFDELKKKFHELS